MDLSQLTQVLDPLQRTPPWLGLAPNFDMDAFSESPQVGYQHADPMYSVLLLWNGQGPYQPSRPSGASHSGPPFSGSEQAFRLVPSVRNLQHDPFDEASIMEVDGSPEDGLMDVDLSGSEPLDMSITL